MCTRSRQQPPPQRAHIHPTDPLRHRGGARAGQGAHTATKVASHTRHSAPAGSVTTSYCCRPGFPGASPCLKHACKSSHARRPTSGRYAFHAPCGQATQPQWWRVHARPRLAATEVAQEPRGVARHSAIHSAKCCRPQRVEGSQRACRNSGLAALPGAGLGHSHNGGAARPQPQRWRDPE